MPAEWAADPRAPRGNRLEYRSLFRRATIGPGGRSDTGCGRDIR